MPSPEPLSSPAAASTATVPATRSRQGSAISSAIRRRRGQPAGPADFGFSGGGGSAVAPDGGAVAIDRARLGAGVGTEECGRWVRGAGVSGAGGSWPGAAAPVATLPACGGADSPSSAAQAARARSPAEA